MSEPRQQPGTASGFIIFCFGLGLIVAASVLNMTHNQWDIRDPNSTLRLVSKLYTSFGAFAVTGVLVGVGVLLIVLSGVFQRPSVSEDDAEIPLAPRGPIFYGPPDAPASRGSRGVVLTTRKYLGQ